MWSWGLTCQTWKWSQKKKRKTKESIKVDCKAAFLTKFMGNGSFNIVYNEKQHKPLELNDVAESRLPLEIQ
jgi:hypothetical protein